jgi:hypothetical protein
MIIGLVLATACQPSQDLIDQAVSSTIGAIPTYTAYPSQTSQLTYTPYPTYTDVPPISVTATYTSTPRFTPTITLTPTTTLIPTSTPDPLTRDKSPGLFLVGVDIAPGVWRSQGGGEDCYWERTTKTGDIIDNYFGMAGGTIYVSPSDFQVRLEKACGVWVHMGPP